MTVLYVELMLNDLQRGFQLEGSRPRHPIPHPKTSFALIQTRLDGVIDSLLATQHVLEMVRRSLPAGPTCSFLGRLSNRLTKLATEAQTPHALRMGSDWAAKRP